MRRIWLIFGLLDLVVVATFVDHVPSEMRSFAESPGINAFCLLMMLSLIASGCGLIRGREWALILNYIQFPFRIALAFLSFAWLAELVEPRHAALVTHEMIWMGAIALEGMRLGATIVLHRIARGGWGVEPAITGVAR